MSEAGFDCPKCGGRMDVKDSRPTHYRGNNSVRRRRVCRKCFYRMTTFEVFDGGDQAAFVRMTSAMASIRRAHEALSVVVEIVDGQQEAAE